MSKASGITDGGVGGAWGKSCDHRLALLLAEASGSQVCQKLVGSQMEEWAELGVSHVTRADVAIG